MRPVLAVAAVLALLSLPAAASGAMRVSPISLEIPAPALTTTLKLTNESTKAVTVQMRAFRWRQADGMDELDPTRQVVVSPPITTLAPRTTQTVRVLRLDRSAVVGSETYRILVDQLPEGRKDTSNRISFLLRHSIPVVFTGHDARPPQLRWSVERSGDRVVLSAANSGDLPLKVASPMLTGRSGRPVTLSDGLLGYVLGGSTMRWTVKPAEGPIPGPGPAALTLHTASGTVNVPVEVQQLR